MRSIASWMAGLAFLVLGALSGCGRSYLGDEIPSPPAATADASAADTGPTPDAAALDGPGPLPDAAPCGKSCGGQCVRLDDPQYGCANRDCSPCSLAHATSTCAAGGGCAVASCDGGWGDCNLIAVDGCEVNLTSDHGHCGSCANACAAQSVCAQSSCQATCGPLTDCNGSCIDTTSDPSHCAGCSNVCPAPPHGLPTCVASQCGFGCDAGFHACGNQCADDSSVNSCGASCTPCTVPANGSAACTGGRCTASCNPGYQTCSTGCCSCGDLQNDPRNCGYCGHDCQGATCTGGVCQAVVIGTLQANAFGIAADDVNVYWTAQGSGANGTVMQAAIAGGAPMPIATAQVDPTGIAVDANNVYWTSYDTVMRVPIGGGMPRTIASNQTAAYALAIDNGRAYFTLDPFQMQGGVAWAPLAGGGAVTPLAQNQAQPTSIAAGSGKVFFGTQTDLMVVPTGGGMPSVFASNVYPYAVTVDTRNVYWGCGINRGAVMQEPIGGGAQITLAMNQSYPDGIAVDATNVYFAVGQGGIGTIMRVPIGGGAPAVALATGQAYPTGIAVNRTRVFWVNFGDGTIRSVAK